MTEGPLLFPAPPEGGGFLVLNKAQIGNLDLLCMIKTVYPQTRIVAQQRLLAADDEEQSR